MSGLASIAPGELRADAVAAVIRAGREAAGRGWVPATSGNFSVRINADEIAITRSGVDKGTLTPADILIQPLHLPLLPGSSAEARLHSAHYLSHPATGAIFHIHGLYSTVLGMAHQAEGAVLLTGWELQKAFAGVRSHLEQIEVPIFANDQEMDGLAERVEARLAQPCAAGTKRAPGYLLAGHGLYAFGANPTEAGRHLEAFEVLFAQVITLRSYRP